MSPAGNHANAMVSPAEAGSGSVAAFTQDLRPGLILFRPDGLASFGLGGANSKAESCAVPGGLDPLFTPTHRSTTPTRPPRRGASWGPR